MLSQPLGKGEKQELFPSSFSPILLDKFQGNDKGRIDFYQYKMFRTKCPYSVKSPEHTLLCKVSSSNPVSYFFQLLLALLANLNSINQLKCLSDMFISWLGRKMKNLILGHQMACFPANNCSFINIQCSWFYDAMTNIEGDSEGH